jgi:hypothetical protein
MQRADQNGNTEPEPFRTGCRVRQHLQQGNERSWPDRLLHHPASFGAELCSPGEVGLGSICWLIDSRRLKGRAVKGGKCGSIGNIAPREAPRSQFADLADRLAMLRLRGQRWRRRRGEPSACREPARIKPAQCREQSGIRSAECPEQSGIKPAESREQSGIKSAHRRAATPTREPRVWQVTQVARRSDCDRRKAPKVQAERIRSCPKVKALCEIPGNRCEQVPQVH